MLQKLENFYLAILRFVVILVAGLLLVAVILLGVRAGGMFGTAPEPVAASPRVMASEVKAQIVKANAAQAGSPAAASTSGTAADPNQAYYERAGMAIKSFLEINYPGQYDASLQALAAMVQEKASAYEDDVLCASYAKNFAENIEELLKDKAIVAYAQENSPGQLVDRIIKVFTDSFDEQVRVTERENSAKQEKFLAEKAEAQQSLYAALGGFGVFLLIVFLSIIIRIERNLRPENRASA
jgi:hypothetical protein